MHIIIFIANKSGIACELKPKVVYIICVPFIGNGKPETTGNKFSKREMEKVLKG
jgi:hypothetical protein